jgi:ribosomal-protein-alanine N-acetyltransferase
MITTDAFYIEPLLIEDAANIHHLMVSNTSTFKTYLPQTLAQNTTLEASQKFVVSKVEKHLSKDEFLFTLKENESNIVAGLIYIKELDWIEKQGEFAYCIDSKFEGKKWMTKAIMVLTNYALNDLGLKTLQIIVHKNNIASSKVAKKCNFIWQKTLKNEFTPPGGIPLDMELYELRQ